MCYEFLNKYKTKEVVESKFVLINSTGVDGKPVEGTQMVPLYSGGLGDLLSELVRLETLPFWKRDFNYSYNIKKIKEILNGVVTIKFTV